jgi:hypothetical protein
MKPSARLGERLVVTGVAVWLVAMPPPTEAQARKSGPDPKPAARDQQDSKGPPRVSLLRLQVIKPEPADANPRARFPRARRVGPQADPPEGTTLTFLVEEPNRLIQSIQTNECRLTRFTDDRDADLLEQEAAQREDGLLRRRWGEPMESSLDAEVRSDGHRATVTIHSPRLPTSGANKIHVEANLVLKYLRGEKTIEQKNVNLKMDRIAATPFPLIIASQSEVEGMVGQQFGREAGTQLVLFHQGPLLGVKGISFIDQAGEEIQATLRGSGSVGSLHQTFYYLAKKVETCTIRMTVPEAVETATVAISMTTGVGFSPAVRRSFVPAPGPGASPGNAAR